jgi:peptide/nickel transport system substrate-binding protein
MKYKKSYFSLLLIAGLMLGACSGGGNTDTPVESTSAAPAVPAVDFELDPANATGDNTRTAVGYLYEGLVKMEGEEVAGVLAESWSVSDDGLDYIFNLRPGVSFHDATPLNADAVVANFNRWFDPASPLRGAGEFAAWASAFGGFKGEATEDGKTRSQYDGIEKVNELTVLVHLNTPDPEFLGKIADPAFSIVSPAILSAGGNDGGTGMYKFASQTGSTVTLEPFAGYWDPAAIPSGNIEVSLD